MGQTPLILFGASCLYIATTSIAVGGDEHKGYTSRAGYEVYCLSAHLPKTRCRWSTWKRPTVDGRTRRKFAVSAADNLGGSTKIHAVQLEKPRGPRARNVSSWAPKITANYPSEALRYNLEGNVGIRLSISETGRVTDCVVIASSGHEVLDTAACEGALQHARFEPAIGADGKATIGEFNIRISFQIPEGHSIPEIETG